jgi:hypothetical protein
MREFERKEPYSILVQCRPCDHKNAYVEVCELHKFNKSATPVTVLAAASSFVLKDLLNVSYKTIKGWTIGVVGFDSRRGLGIFLFITASRTALGPTQPPIQWVPEALCLEVKRSMREADHSPPPSAEVKEFVELYLHFPNAPS